MFGRSQAINLFNDCVRSLFVACGPIDAVFSVNFGDRHTRFAFIENFDDLAFAVTALYYIWLLFSEFVYLSPALFEEPFLSNTCKVALMS